MQIKNIYQFQKQMFSVVSREYCEIAVFLVDKKEAKNVAYFDMAHGAKLMVLEFFRIASVVFWDWPRNHIWLQECIHSATGNDGPTLNFLVWIKEIQEIIHFSRLNSDTFVCDCRLLYFCVLHRFSSDFPSHRLLLIDVSTKNAPKSNPLYEENNFLGMFSLNLFSHLNNTSSHVLSFCYNVNMQHIFHFLRFFLSFVLQK